MGVMGTKAIVLIMHSVASHFFYSVPIGFIAKPCTVQAS